VALRGLRSDRSRADTGSARPVRRFDAHRVLSDRTSGRPKPSGAPPALSRPFRGPSQQPRTVPQALRPPSDASSPGLFVPYDTLSNRRIRSLERCLPAPPRATSEVWLPPSRRPPPVLPAHEAPERPWASPFKASPVLGGVPLGTPALLTFLHRAPPCGRRGSASAFRALISARARDRALTGPTSRPSWVSPLRSIHPLRPGRRL